MSVAENEAVVRRHYEEVVGDQQFDIVDQICAPDFVGFRDLITGSGRDRAGFKEHLRHVRQALPDLRQTIIDWVANDDRVVVVFVIHGTHRGDYLGVPATGKELTIRGVDIWQVQSGRIIRHAIVLDRLGALRQMGATVVMPG